MKKIQKDLQNFLSNPEANIAHSGTYKVKEFINLTKVLKGTKEDFLIFNNGGGRKFDIVFDRILPDEKGKQKLYPVQDFIKYLLKNNKNWIYCYQLNNKQVIINKI